MGIETREKHPESSLDYGFDLTDWLTAPEQVSTVAAQLIAGDVVLGSTSTDGTRAAVFVSGGTAGVKSQVEFTITTNSVPPRVLVRSMDIYVKII